MASNYRKLGELITQRREKNPGGDLPIRGVSQDGFIPPKQGDADTSIYNIFYRNDFVYNPARMELGSIAFNDKWDMAICSSLYEVFYVHRTDLVLPEYLALFVARDEFARNCEFLGSGSAREYCRFANISEIKIRLPSIEEQRKKVEIFAALNSRVSVLQQLNDKLAACAEAIFANAFLGTEREMAPITQFATIGAGGDKPTPCVVEPTAECCIPVYSNGIEDDGLYGYTNRAKAMAGSTTISARGTIGYVCLRTCDYVPIVRLISVTPKKGVSSHYLYLYLRTLHIEGVGSTQQQLTAPMVKGYNVPLASADEMATFDEKVKPLFDLIDQTRTEIALLQELKQGMLTEIAGAVG